MELAATSKRVLLVVVRSKSQISFRTCGVAKKLLQVFLIDNNYVDSMDFYLIGNMGRRIAYQSETIPSALKVMTALVEINRLARKKLMVALLAKRLTQDRKEVTNRIEELDKDLDSWLKGQNESGHPNEKIVELLKSNHWLTK